MGRGVLCCYLAGYSYMLVFLDFELLVVSDVRYYLWGCIYCGIMLVICLVFDLLWLGVLRWWV